MKEFSFLGDILRSRLHLCTLREAVGWVIGMAFTHIQNSKEVKNEVVSFVV